MNQKSLTLLLLFFVLLIALQANLYADATTADGFDYPVGIPDHTGWEKSQDFNDYYAGKGYHLGEDWINASGATEGEKVYSLADGVVIRAGSFGTCWKGVVIILHTAPAEKFFNLPSGKKSSYVTSLYAHLTNIQVKQNDKVFKGQEIGAIAPTTSCSTGPHLHLEIRKHVYNNRGGIPLGPGYLSKPVGENVSWGNPSDFIDLNRSVFTAKYTVRMYNVDDLATLYINGVPLYKAKWGYYGIEPNWYYYGHTPGDSGEFEITSYLAPGVNSLRFTLWNEAVPGSASLSIEVKKDGVPIFSDSFFKNDSSSGIKYDRTITVIKE